MHVIDCLYFSVVYDYDGDHYFIDYIDTKGKLKAKLVWVSIEHVFYAKREVISDLG